MIEYMRTGECLMQFLGRALDDPNAGKCGKCANCLGRDLVPTTITTELANRAGIFLKRSYQILHPRKQWPLKDMFEQYPFKGKTIEVDLLAEEGRALSLWGDTGWGQMVREGKYRARKFPDELVDGCLQMIAQWDPTPKPTWVTCIPSLTHPDLVPDFAKRLAARMGIPFVPCLKKVRKNQQQKTMQNSYQQVKNLDGAFEAEKGVMPAGTALLVDDMVDSRWTFAIAAALLRQAGCPAVLPVALALNSPRSD